ncbi:FliH/SctL family protein [Tumebacillus sp. DT12]|uniref:FliH/SctL family protein n=1 Tax=Tumebacillus lacus TaxID=2995335 RepID=A0ABT3WV17_9BACL|nr:FliH/SctL family protein [Tumebacillus lacus]MCX7568515.1 FliH/SctL family protein [Tumebacillus lacus]
MSKLFKASRTSMTPEAYQIQVTRFVKDAPAVPIDPEWEMARQAAFREAEAIRQQAREEAAQLVGQAQEEAMNLLTRERERVESILLTEIETAKAQGYEDGRLAAEQQVAAEWSTRFDEVEQLHHLAVEERHRYLAESEPMLVELAVAVARKIIHQELSVSSEWVSQVVSRALEEIHDAGKIEVRVHPADYETVQARREGLRKEVPGQSELLILPDRGVDRGGCVVQTAFGNVDARLDTQLEEVKKALQEVAAGLKP